MVEKRLEAIMYQGGRLPPAHFPPLTLLKILFRKMKVLSRRNTDDCLFQMWNFLISAEKILNPRSKNTFFSNNSFWIKFYIKFSTYTDFEKFKFFQKQLIFLKPESRPIWEISFQSHSTANLLQFGDQFFARSDPTSIGHFHIGHYRLAKS